MSFVDELIAKFPSRKLKILHAPVNIANQGWFLSRGQRKLGHSADLFSLNQSYASFQPDKILDYNTGKCKDRLIKVFSNINECLDKDYDVYHFYYYATLFPKSCGLVPFADVNLFRHMGKKVFFHLVGCDFRLPGLSYERNPQTMCVDCQKCFSMDKIETLKAISQLASGLIVGGEQANFFLGGFQGNLIPIAIDTTQFTGRHKQRDRPVIIHSPTNRLIKGTDPILKAIETLRHEGLNFEFSLIENMPHAECLKALEESDILIDQLGSDFYATAAIEAMAAGTVVMTSALDSSLDQFGATPPIVQINKDLLLERLREIIPNIIKRQKLADLGINYAKKYHHYENVAKIAIDVYSKPLPPYKSGEDPNVLASKLKNHNDESMGTFPINLALGDKKKS